MSSLNSTIWSDNEYKAAAITTAAELGKANCMFAFSASSRITDTSAPTKVAGNKPKVVKALNRPPIFVSAYKTLNPSLLPAVSSGEFSSVMMTICFLGSKPLSMKTLVKYL